MKPITRWQREALAAVYRRTELYTVPGHPDASLEHDPQELGQDPATYRQFRRTVQPECYGGGLMVHWCGMWLGIEPDGYTHS